MKFENYDCWKHKNCLDAFFVVSSIVQDDKNCAILNGNWAVQGVESCWFASNICRIFIKDDQYDAWRRYEPKGRFLYR